jgi:MFS family permease
MDTSAVVGSSPWYRSLNREQWRVLIASNLAWLFDSFEIYALFLTIGFALHQLLDAAQYAQIPRYAGYVLATTIFGWATGGVIGGIVADYIGCKRTMMLAILAYSLTTGLSAIAWNGNLSRFCGSWLALGSARNGRPEPRSFPNCGPTTRAVKAADCCKAVRGSAAFSPLECGC